MDHLVLPPLRIPTDTPLADELETWLQDVHRRRGGTATTTTTSEASLPLAEECRTDVQRLGRQRTAVRKLLLQGHAVAADHADVLWEYAGLLRSFAAHGFATVLRKAFTRQHQEKTLGDSLTSLESMGNHYSHDNTNNGTVTDVPPKISLAWQTGSDNEEEEENCMLWEWEQANVWWTLAVLEVYRGQSLGVTADNATTWKQVMGHYTTAATWMTYLQQTYFGATALSNHQPTQYLWSVGHDLSWEGLNMRHALWTATAQRVGTTVFKPPLLKAKIYAAAALLYEDLGKLLKEHKDEPYWTPWRRYAAVWVPFCQALAQAQQAAAHATRGESTLAFQRYRRAIDWGEDCQKFTAHLSTELQQSVAGDVTHVLQQLLPEWQDKCGKIVEETPAVAASAVDGSALPAIPPYKVTKTDLQSVIRQVDAADDALEPPPFATLLSQDLRSQVFSFQAQMETLLNTTVRRAEEKAESGRRALAIHNLPHELAAYQQSIAVDGNANGGLPEGLWEKIDALQQSNKISLLQQELWELKDMADMTQQTYKKIHTLLDEDLRMDRDFRKDHPHYGGHNVEGVQTRYRQALQNYQSLMETASKSDAQLLRRLEELPTDTKFKLLSKSKAQLDCLLPASSSRAQPIKIVDVTPLSQALAALSELFRERDELVQELTTAVRKFNLMEFVQEVIHDPPDQTTAALQSIFQSAQESLQDMVTDIQRNMNKQTDLVKRALDENVRFVKARDEYERSRSSAGLSTARTNRTLVMINQAIEEVDELSKYLEEGKAFYNVVLPKLQRVLTHVEDLSTRLTIARCEYEDKAQMSRQEEEDARFAASMADSSHKPADPPDSFEEQPETDNLNASADSLLELPDVASLSLASNEGSGKPSGTNGAHSRRIESDNEDLGDAAHGVARRPKVDDEKVAHLVGMDFDPEKVVEALIMYNNDMEDALNHLLTGG